MNDNYDLEYPTRVGRERDLCRVEFVALMRRLKASGVSWNAISGGLEAAQAQVDQSIVAVAERCGRRAAQRRSART